MEARVSWLVITSVLLVRGESSSNIFSQSNTQSLRVVGGTNAEKHIAPWVISLQFGTHLCGGAILAPEWILTAAHCVSNKRKVLTVAAGRHDLRANVLTEQRRMVWKTFIHPEYTRPIGPNDIALIQLQYPLQFTSSVNRIKLPSSGNDDENGSAILYGWGSISRNKYPLMPSILQTMTAPIMHTDVCRKKMQFGSISEKQLCTGATNERLSACLGDSGSALTKGDGSSAIIIGIVSWGFEPCGASDAATVYTRVSVFTSWIIETVKNVGRFSSDFPF